MRDFKIHMRADITKLKYKQRIPYLIKKVRVLEFKHKSDVALTNDLSASIYETWKQMRNSFHKKMRASGQMQTRYYEEYNAIEEMLVSLFLVINEKIQNYILGK